LNNFDSEEVDIIDKFGNETLSPPLVISKINIKSKGLLFNAARIDRYRYAPYPPHHIFRSVLAIKSFLGYDDLFFVIDTNLNPVSLSLLDVASSKIIKKCEEEIDQINLTYFVTPSVFARYKGYGEKGDIELLKLTVNSFNRFGLKTLGKNGENIIYLFTPTVYDEELFLKGLLSTLKTSLGRMFGIRKEYISIESSTRSKGILKKILDFSMEPYMRSSRRLNLDELKDIRTSFLDFLNAHGFTLETFIKNATATDIQSLFFAFILDSLYDSTTNTMPRNSIIIPFIVKSLINFVDIVLLAENLNESIIIKKQGPIYTYLREWIEKVYLRGL